MFTQRNFLLVAAMATAAARPAMWQAPSVGATVSKTHSAASVPNFSRVWTHPAFPWFEPPASAPNPITNLSCWPEQRPPNRGRLGGFASQQGGCQQLRPAGRGSQKSNPAALGGGGGQAVWRNVAGRHHVPQPLEPVLAFAV